MKQKDTEINDKKKSAEGKDVDSAIKAENKDEVVASKDEVVASKDAPVKKNAKAKSGAKKVSKTAQAEQNAEQAQDEQDLGGRIGSVACCGTDCDECKYHDKNCAGCDKHKGNVFWLEYVEVDVCPIYECCRKHKKLVHCGECELLPCNRFFRCVDPNITALQHFDIVDRQVSKLEYVKANMAELMKIVNAHEKRRRENATANTSASSTAEKKKTKNKPKSDKSE